MSCLKLENLEQGSQEWLNFRKDKIGASDIASIMGKSPWKTAYDLWAEKTGRKKESESNFAMRRGTQLEPQARQILNEKFGVDLQPAVVVHKDFEWAIASLDGISLDGKTIVEIKCPLENNYLEMVATKKPLDHYIYQCQWQLFVTDLQKLNFMVYSPNNEFLNDYDVFVVDRDDKLIAEILEAVKEFRQCILEDRPPTASKNQKLVFDSLEASILSQEYLELAKQHDSIKQALERKRDELLAASGGLSRDNDYVSIVWSEGRETINYRAMLQDLGAEEEARKKYTKIGIPFATVKIKTN